MAESPTKSQAAKKQKDAARRVDDSPDPAGKTNSTAAESSSRKRRPFIRVLVILLMAVIVIEAFFIARWGMVRWSLVRAHQLSERMEYEQAIEKLAYASRWSPTNGEVQYQLAVTYRHANKSREFEAHLAEAERLGIDSDRINHQKDLMIAQGGFYDSASGLQKIIDSGNATDDEAAEIYDAMAKGYMAAYRIGDALRCLNFWIEWDPDTVVGHYHRADVHFRMGNLRNSMGDYEFVLAQAPEHFETNLRVGRLLQESNAVDEAINYFEKAHQVRPDDVDAILTLADCNLMLDRQDQAKQLATELLETKLEKHERAFALELLGRIGLRQGKYVDALRYLEEALSLAPKDADVNYTMGSILRSLGDKERAQQFLDFSQKLKERDLRFRDLTAQLILEPHNNDYRFEIAMLLWDQELYEPAAMWLVTIVNADPDHEASHRMLADYYAKTGRPNLARGHSERAMLLSTRPRSPETAPEGG